MEKGQHGVTTSSAPPTPRLSLVHRLLITAIVSGAVVIAGIGFAGSYAAVRALALKKGFGNFSYVFPIGIDAGICVLLALDLLLTWIRIPFPLLRQTAWLLTAATIAFNGAAAWPDPLGVGMHAVIPVLFVVSVEAARHAIGRIADITADKHMEGVRLTRWLLSPIPTFLLWRRMKLWELRSYEQVIKLEQDRLIYQARLHSRFGRAWKRKAPVESLMPLRLARYGVPLAQTAPSGLAAAGIEPALLPPLPQQPALDTAADTAADLYGVDAAQAGAAAEGAGKSGRHQGNQVPRNTVPEGIYPVDVPEEQHQQAYEQQPHLRAPHHPAEARQMAAGDHDTSGDDLPCAPGDAAGDFEQDRFLDAYRAWLTEHQALPTAGQFGHYPDAAALSQYVLHRDGVMDAHGRPLPAEDLSGFLNGFWQRQSDDINPERVPPAALSEATAAHAKTPEDGETSPSISAPTAVDRYYLGWHDFQQQHGREPNGAELSAHLAERNVLDREGQPIKSKALTRYFLEFRLYTTWAGHREHTRTPTMEQIVADLAQRGIAAQYNRPIQASDVTKYLASFERRWTALAPHHSAEPSPQRLPGDQNRTPRQ